MNQHVSDLTPHAVATDPFEYWNAALSISGHPLGLSNGYQFQYETCDVPEPDTPAFTAATAEGAKAIIVLDDYPFADELGVSLTLDSLSALEPALRDDLLAGTVAHLRATAPEMLQELVLDLPMRPLSQLDELSGEHQWLSFTYAQPGKTPVRLRMGVHPLALGVFLKSVPLTAQPLWKSLRQQLTVSVSLQACVEHLPLSQIRALEVGDLILLSAEGLGQRMRVEGPHSVHHLFLAEQGWACESIATKESAPQMSEDLAPQTEPAAEPAEPAEAPAAPGAEEVAPSFADMPLAVSFEIDERQMSVAELEGWQAGALIPLDVPALSEEMPIFVRAGGKRIAQGNLVQIDSRIALRISKLLG